MRQFCLGVITVYQRWISPAFPPACRFEPTCSHYASQAIRQYGVLTGLGMAVVRLLKCHPFHPGGIDPVQ
jgi:putative membrane protein insertion efficiency factor